MNYVHPSGPAESTTRSPGSSWVDDPTPAEDLDLSQGEDGIELNTSVESQEETEVDHANEGKQIVNDYCNFLNKIHTIKHVPSSTVDVIASEYEKLETFSLESRKNKLRNKLREWFPEDLEHSIESRVEEVFDDGDLADATRNLKSSHNRKMFLRDNFACVEPQEYILNKEEVRRNCRKDSIHYISISQTLYNLQNDRTFQFVKNEEDEERMNISNIYKDVKDGRVYRNSTYFQSNPDAFTLLCYSDGLLVVKPLSASKNKHKVVPVYFTVAEAPRRTRSKLKHIFLAQVFEERLLKKYPLATVFNKFTDEIKQLEAGIVVNGQLIKASILLYSADNLESHLLGGFSMCFSSKDVCRSAFHFLTHEVRKSLKPVVLFF